MRWTKKRILDELRSISRKGQSLAYSVQSRKRQALVSAAAYHFGSYRVAVEKAGLVYAEHLQRPRWTKQTVIAKIKQARRAGRDLHWGAVTGKRDDLCRAAHAAISPRLFGSWPRALHAAGIDADEVAIYRRWDKHTIAFELRARAADREPLNSGQLQKDDPGLHSACLRFFGGYAEALRAAGIDPDQHRRRRRWTKERVIDGLKRRLRRKLPATEAAVRRDEPTLLGAAIRLFGSFKSALAAARRQR